MGMSKVLNVLRAAIKQAEAEGISRYRIAKESGVPQSALSRLMNGERGLSIESVERLAVALGFGITIEPKGKSKKGR